MGFGHERLDPDTDSDTDGNMTQAKIDPNLKKEAEKRFRLFGLDSATATRLFFSKVVQTNRIPFTIGCDPCMKTEQSPYETTPEEDAYDVRAAERAYADYKANGCKSRPFAELLKET